MVIPDASKTHKREDVREAILDAMGDLIKRMGYHKTTVEDVAGEAGIGKGTVYLHFCSKEEIALQWLDRVHAPILGALEAVAAGPEPAVERAEKILVLRIMLRFDLFTNYPLSVEQMMATLSNELNERKERFHAREEELLASLLSEISGEPASDRRSFAKAMILGTNALLPYRLRPEQMGSRETHAENAWRIAELLVAGYVVRETKHP